MSLKASFDLYTTKFATRAPDRSNALNIYKGSWKFGYDRMSYAEIRANILRDPRPQWCAEVYPDFHRLRIVELGPADGYNTAGLEFAGARNVTAIEGNVDAFLRCLILKNYLGLQAEFILGDFVEYFEEEKAQADLVYASGMLYHLQNPLKFLYNVSKLAPHLYLWTHFYEAAEASRIENEKQSFASREQRQATVGNATATYYRRDYNIDHVSAAGYIGGLHQFANWISRNDLFAALEAYGYRIKRVVDDPAGPGIMPAVNILASQE
jgi:hypothetical protein